MRKKLSLKSLISIALLLATLIFGIFKNYVWVNFRTGTGEMLVREYSLISTTILGYGLIFPLLVMLITAGLLFFGVLSLFKTPTKKSYKRFKIFSGIVIICLILPIIIGMQIFNKGIAIMLLLLVSNFVLSFTNKIND